MTLYVTSFKEMAGKTALCAALGKKLVDEGKRVGFFKPLLVSPEKTGSKVVDPDIDFMRGLLNLGEPAELLYPYAVSPQMLSDLSALGGLIERVRENLLQLSRDKDVVFLEGLTGFAQSSLPLITALDAKVVLVVRYGGGLGGQIAEGKIFGPHLAGVVINFVPQERRWFVETQLKPSFEREGVGVLGIFPEDHALLGISVGELNEKLRGRLLNSLEYIDEFVENLMVGVMSLDPASLYFSRKSNKAVIVRGDRPDIQIAALETSIKCLILTNNIQPIPLVLHRAQEKHVPIMVVEKDTLSTIAEIEELMAGVRFRGEMKVRRFLEILNKYFDFKALGMEGR